MVSSVPFAAAAQRGGAGGRHEVGRGPVVNEFGSPHERADREAAPEGLPEHDRVRHHVGVFEREELARPTQPRLHLVDDEVGVRVGTEVRERLQEAVGRDAHAAVALERLRDQARNVLGLERSLGGLEAPRSVVAGGSGWGGSGNGKVTALRAAASPPWAEMAPDPDNPPWYDPSNVRSTSPSPTAGTARATRSPASEPACPSQAFVGNAPGSRSRSRSASSTTGSWRTERGEFV